MFTHGNPDRRDHELDRQGDDRPPIRVSELARRTEVKRTGVYLLVGPDPDSPTKDRVHAGEGDNVLTRLVTYVGDETKDFWTRTVVVTSKDENLT